MNLPSKGAFSVGEIKDVKFGTVQVDKIFIGTDLVFEKIIDTTAPTTSIRPIDAVNNPTNTYTDDQTVYFDVNEMSDTYYTMDGTTPTTASTKYVGNGILIDKTTTFKYFSVDQAGNTEAVKTTTYTINKVPQAPAYPRYIRFVGYGDNVSGATTRLVELKAMYGATNLLLNKLPMAGYKAPDTGNTIDKATDGIITHASGSYPIWWSGVGIPSLVYDLLDWYDVSQIVVVMYSPNTDPRQTKFKIDISANNVDWFNVVDYSTNTTPQPEAGFTFNV
jgi:hypothetical protein